jgi:hypothetical protein
MSAASSSPPTSGRGDDAAAHTTPPVGFGLIVSPMPQIEGDHFLFAEVVPAGSRWFPWPGRTSRWWFEVHAQHAPDEHGVTGTTYAYTEGGSGGAFTLRGCVSKAMEAVDKFVWEDEADAE